MAYRLDLQDRNTHISEESSNSMRMKEFWKFIWHIWVPNKIWAFTWRACRNFPTKENLFRRQVSQDNLCEVCGDYEETSGHLFWQCSRAKEVWTEAGFAQDKIMDRCPEFLDLLWYARNVKNWSDEDIRLMATTAWGIWSNRNKVRHGKSRKPASILAWWTKGYLENFLMANHNFRPYQEPVEAVWQLPKSPWYKINTVGPVFERRKEMGIWIIIWDHHSATTVTLSKKLQVPLGPLEVEAKAMEEAITFAWDMAHMGFKECIFKSDAQVMVNVVLRLSDPPSQIANNIIGSLSQLYRFCLVQFSHMPRSRNKVAHALAQYTRDISNFQSWIEETPSVIESLVSQDVLFLSSAE